MATPEGGTLSPALPGRLATTLLTTAPPLHTCAIGRAVGEAEGHEALLRPGVLLPWLPIYSSYSCFCILHSAFCILHSAF